MYYTLPSIQLFYWFPSAYLEGIICPSMVEVVAEASNHLRDTGLVLIPKRLGLRKKVIFFPSWSRDLRLHYQGESLELGDDAGLDKVEVGEQEEGEVGHLSIKILFRWKREQKSIFVV